MTIIDKESILKAFNIESTTIDNTIKETKEGYTIVPEHPINPATFAITFDTNWIIPNKYHISSLAVFVYTFRNNNKPPKINDLLDMVQQAVQETNELISKELKNKKLDIDKLEIMPVNSAKTLLTLQDCLTRAYSVN